MSERGYEDLRVEGINAVASLMGHVAAASDEHRFEGAISVVTNLPTEGLAAGYQHLRACWDALDDPALYSMVPPDERSAYRSHRMWAIMTAFYVVKAAVSKR